jgi:hypothetical protein
MHHHAPALLSFYYLMLSSLSIVLPPALLSFYYLLLSSLSIVLPPALLSFYYLLSSPSITSCSPLFL